ncbi:MAG: amino acid permease [Candidatus Poseidoniaceae archaeon]|nr:amino acid permease [Candidatus Poseidoniaceae archaeon]
MTDLSPKALVGNAKDELKNTLKRTTGLAGVVIISLSAMLPGIFVTPTFAAEIMGPGIWLAYLLAASVVLPGALSKSELSSGMPSSGGSYVYLERTYGPLIGTISGLGLWASFLLKSAFALIGFSAYLIAVTTYFDVEISIMVLSMSALVLITVVNIFGVSKVKAIQAPIVMATVGLLVFICLAALFVDDFDAKRPLTHAFDSGVWSIAEAAAFVFVAYAGVTKVAAIGGEVKNPEKNLPAGIMLSLLIATVLYTAIAYLMMAAIPGEWWMQDGKVVENPIFVFAEKVAGTEFGIFAAILSVLTMISMALAGILASSRFLFAMSRDNLLPQALEEVNVRFETPHWPILVTGVAMGMAILFVPLKDVVKLASGFKIMIFIMINSCVIILRRTSKEHGWDPSYKAPWYPYIHLWGIIAGGILIAFIGSKAFIGGGAAVFSGAATYYLYGKQHSTIQTTPVQSFRKQFRFSTPAEHDRRLAAFHAADYGGKNHLTLREFQNALKALGFEYSTDEFRHIFHTADADENGVIDIDEFFLAFELDGEE